MMRTQIRKVAVGFARESFREKKFFKEKIVSECGAWISLSPRILINFSRLIFTWQ